MKKILSFFAAMLVAVAVNASTDFAAPGYYCAADDAVITGDAPSNKVYLDESADPHHIAWSDVSKTYTAVIKWTVAATRACYISVSLDLGPTISSNKHIFEVKVLDANGAEVGALEEGPAYTGDGFTDANTVKALTGKIMIPAPGDYTVELRNNRDFCKGSIKNVILTYAGAAPITDFATPGYSCAADEATLSGTVSSSFGLNTDGDDHYVFWSDRALSSPAAASWSLIATRACYITASLDLGPVISSNKHIFEIKVLDAQGEEVGTAAEPGESTEANQVKALTQQILIPEAGSYTIELRNNRDWGKGAVKNVILAYAADAPAAEPQMKTIYCKMDKDWWKESNAAIGCYTWNDKGEPKAAWPGERMTPVEGETDIWSIELDINTYHMCIFTRVNGEGDVADWGAKTTDLTIPTDENDMFTITNDDPTWGDPGCVGAWSKYEPAAPVGCDWENIDWLGSADATYSNQFKVCVGNPAPTEIVNIQKPGFASEFGIYISFPSAAFGEISLPAEKYAVQGAGIVFYVSAFTAKETEVSVVCEGQEIVFTVYNAKGTDTPTAIESNVVAVKTVKMIENGQLVIIRNGEKFNAQGQVIR